MVEDDFDLIGEVSQQNLATIESISTMSTMGNRDEVVLDQLFWKILYKQSIESMDLS